MLAEISSNLICSIRNHDECGCAYSGSAPLLSRASTGRTAGRITNITAARDEVEGECDIVNEFEGHSGATKRKEHHVEPMYDGTMVVVG